MEKNDLESQIDKFKDLARELECDETEEAFDEALAAVAGAPPDGATHIGLDIEFNESGKATVVGRRWIKGG